MDEGKKRDAGIKRAKDNPDNNYEAILRIIRNWLVRRVPFGHILVSGEAFRVAMDGNPNLKPQEKRVMGAVMRQLQRERLIIGCGISTRERSHRGFAREWKRTRAS